MMAGTTLTKVLVVPPRKTTPFTIASLHKRLPSVSASAGLGSTGHTSKYGLLWTVHWKTPYKRQETLCPVVSAWKRND